MQLPRPCPGWCDLPWPSSAKTAVLFSPQLPVQKLPVHCHLSTPPKERGVLLWTACAHTRRQGWTTDCFVRDRETLWERVEGALSRRNETQSSKQTGWDSLWTNILHVDLMQGWESKRRKEGENENEWKVRQATWPADELCVCVCSWGQLGDLKDTTVEGRIHDYYWFSTRLGADSSPARRRTGFTVLDQMKTLSHD